MRFIEPQFLAVDRPVSQPKHVMDRPVIGVHLASLDDEDELTAICVRTTDSAKCIYAYEDTSLIAKTLTDMYKELRCKSIQFNSNAELRGISKLIPNRSYTWQTISVLQDAYNQRKYANLRTELYFRAKECIENHNFYLDDNIKYDLSHLQCFQDEKGRFLIQSYELDTNPRVSFPSAAEAFMLTFSPRYAGVW